MERQILEREIFIWMRAWNNFSLFPREVGVKYKDGGLPRRVVDEVDFWDFLFVNNWKDVYANIFSQRQKTTRTYDTFLIDVDYHSGKNIMEEIEKSFEYYTNILNILDDMGLKGRYYFTGRGFHIFVDFKPTRLEYYPKVIKEFIGNNLKGVPGVDFRVLGDRNRMARLVGSYHGGSSLRMVRIDRNWDLDKIFECSLGFEECVLKTVGGENNISEELEEIDIGYRERYSRNNMFSNVDVDISRDVLGSFDNLPPCVKDGINRLAKTGELEHLYRLHIASYLLRVWNYEDVVKVFSMASDFSERLTRYHLDYIIDNEIWPFSCKNAVMQGICPYGENYKKCLFYQLSDGWIGRLIGGSSDGGE